MEGCQTAKGNVRPLPLLSGGEKESQTPEPVEVIFRFQLFSLGTKEHEKMFFSEKNLEKKKIIPVFSNSKYDKVDFLS